MKSNLTAVEAFRINMNETIDALDRYLDYLGAGVKNELDRTATWLEHETKNLDQESRQTFFDFFYEDIFDAEKEFPRRVYSSFVAHWYSTYEKMLLAICDFYKLKLNIGPFDIERIGKGIERAHNIFRQSMQYEIEQVFWNELLLIRNLRNRLVHNSDRFHPVFVEPQTDGSQYQRISGFIDGVDFFIKIGTEFYKYLNTYDLLKYRNSELMLVPTNAYCKHLIRFGTQSLNSILKDCETRLAGS